MSSTRILASHGGVLPRPEDLQKLADENRDDEFAARLPSAVAEGVQKQIDCGMDIVNDGEYVKRSGFNGYIRERMQGIEPRPAAPVPQAGSIWTRNRTGARDQNEFPGFHAAHRNNSSVTGSFIKTPDGGGWAPGPSNPAQACVGPITYVGYDAIKADTDGLKAGLKGQNVEGFMASLGPGTFTANIIDEHYPTREALLFGAAEALREEYKAIVDAGFILQIDEPELGRAYQFYPTMTIEEYQAYTALRIEAINHALEGIPADRVRLHFCWGSGHRPHKNDVPVGVIMPTVLNARVHWITWEASNPRHDWEWVIWEDLKLPDDKVIMPGVVGHASDIIEHPELIAQRLGRFAKLVGPDKVMAGTDCGLGTRVGHAEICWAKLAAMSEGCKLASERL
jgi:5-methyltetrahydropteroyltriglutamate--homocysteine methyltransferase